MSSERVYCGRTFSNKELQIIRKIITTHPQARRAQLSRYVCEEFGWRRVDGRLKDMSCRVAMLRMHDDGLLVLPPPRNGNNNGKPYRRRTLLAEPPQSPITLAAGLLPGLRLEAVTDSTQSHLWNEFIDRYHYLGYQPLPGAQLRYFVRSQRTTLALLGFGAAAWKVAPRDRFIGWTPTQRKQRLHQVVNNARFLILPWVHSQNLASKLLAMAARRLSNDWEQRYGHRVLLLETFVEHPRFTGTCYKAANWLKVGQTQGCGNWMSNTRPDYPPNPSGLCHWPEISDKSSVFDHRTSIAQQLEAQSKKAPKETNRLPRPSASETPQSRHPSNGAVSLRPLNHSIDGSPAKRTDGTPEKSPADPTR